MKNNLHVFWGILKLLDYTSFFHLPAHLFVSAEISSHHCFGYYSGKQRGASASRNVIFLKNLWQLFMPWRIETILLLKLYGYSFLLIQSYPALCPQDLDFYPNKVPVVLDILGLITYFIRMTYPWPLLHTSNNL